MKFFETLIFKVLYLLKMCPIFIGSVQNSSLTMTLFSEKSQTDSTDDCLTPVLQLSEECLLSARLSDKCQTTARQLPDNCLTISKFEKCYYKYFFLLYMTEINNYRQIILFILSTVNWCMSKSNVLESSFNSDPVLTIDKTCSSRGLFAK